MAPKTKFLTNDPLTRKKWARDLFPFVLKNVEFNELIGSDSNSIIQMKTDLSKGEGDQLTFGLRLPLTGEGIVGDATVEGNEEKMRFRNFKMTVEELNHAVDTGGKMEEQRIPYNLFVEGKAGLQDWWADKLSDMLFNHLCGVTGYRVAGKTFAQNPLDPDTDHWMRVNDAASDGAITSADVLDLGFLDRMKQRAELPASDTGYRVRPIMMKGKKYYRVILHNYVFDMLKTQMNAGDWGDLQRNAGKLGVPVTEIEYNGLLISKSERIKAVSPGAYRNVLLGAQAAVMGWGGAGESKSTTMAFVPYEKDAKRFVMIRGGGILGIRKTRFIDQDAADTTGSDYGIVTGTSYGAALS